MKPNEEKKKELWRKSEKVKQIFASITSKAS